MSQLGHTNTPKIEAPWDQLGMGHRLWASELILLFGLSLRELSEKARCDNAHLFICLLGA